MPAYHLRTFYLARQPAWNVTSNLNFFRLEGVTDGSVTVTIEDEIVKTAGWNVGHITITKLRYSEITISLVATYEQIIYILHALFGPVTPSGTQSPYIWTYKAPSTNSSIPQLYVIRYGIDDDIYQLSNCFLTELSIKGSANNFVELDVTLLSPYSPDVNFTVPNVTYTYVNAIHVQHANFYLSTYYENPFDTSEIDAVLRSFEINIDTSRHIKRFIGNNIAENSYYGDGKWDITGSLVVEFNSTSKSIIDSMLFDTPKQNLGLRFVCLGEPVKKMFITMPFIFNESYELFSDADGNATVELKIESLYNPLFNTALQVEVQTNTDTLQ